MKKKYVDVAIRKEINVIVIIIEPYLFLPDIDAD